MIQLWRFYQRKILFPKNEKILILGNRMGYNKNEKK
jgi:hypothetical protein